MLALAGKYLEQRTSALSTTSVATLFEISIKEKSSIPPKVSDSSAKDCVIELTAEFEIALVIERASDFA